MLNILLVENDPGYSGIMEDKLEILKHQQLVIYKSVNNGKHAINLLKSGSYDLVLLDLKLKDGDDTDPKKVVYDGITIGEQIRFENKNVVIFMYSSDIIWYEEEKFDHYISCKSSGADKIIYVEHPDNVDPVAMLGNEEKQKEVAHRLFERTQSRIGGLDNYDWSQAETITDFRNMIDVSVRVPERIHEAFLKNVGQSLNSLGDSVTRLPNPQVSDVEERERLLTEELEKILN